MVCTKCGSEEIFKGETAICPSCNKLNILDKDIALQVIQKQIDWFNKGFYDVLRTFNKKRLLVWLLGEREKVATNFFVEKPAIQLNDFIAINVLIKRVMKDGNNSGEKQANEENTKQLVDLFSSFVSVAERYHIINEGFGYYSNEKEFDIKNLDFKTLMSNFKIFYNNEWKNVVKTFGSNLVMPESEGEKYFEKYKEEYEKVKINPPKPQHFSDKQTVSALFPLFQSLIVSFTKNNLFAQTFDIDYLKKANLSPTKLLDLVKTFKHQSGLMNLCSEGEFKTLIKKIFVGFREQIIYKNLVFSQENQDIFPLFVKIEGDIITSVWFTNLLSLYYYPIYHKNIFDEEIRKRGDDFEKQEVPNQFKSFGFNVHPQIKDKKKATLEIDGLAWKGDILYVIECKIWDIKPYFEHRKIHLHRERDLKGIVDGKSYTTKDNLLIEKDVPSLTEKISFIKENLKNFCPDYSQIKEVEGLIITKSYPPIKEYKGIKIKAFDEIVTLR